MADKSNRKELNIQFHGGSDEVTGSRHLISLGEAKVMLDCGLFQGHRHEAIEKNRTFPIDPKELDAVLLSHAHMDHSGGLPFLFKKGFSNPIHCTPPTAELIQIMLMDSAFLQVEDAKFFNKIHRQEGLTIEPLYTQEDVEKTLALVQTHEYGELFDVADGLKAMFLNAGHIMGSAMIQVEAQTDKGLHRLLFTGDLGRRKSLIMKPPEIPKHVDTLLIESTYGGRDHTPISEAENTLKEIILRVSAEKGRILIPSFALERTQEIVYVLEKLRRENKIPPIHLYVDSPMASSVTKVFNKNLACFCLSEEFKKYINDEGDPFGMKSVRYVESVEESKALNEQPGQKIIISASGMCEGGRILHHLRNFIGRSNTTILLVGYQAKGTLGRRIWEGQKKVKIFGLMHDVTAQIEMMENFSSHADRSDLLWFVKNLAPRPRKVFLVHGDSDQRRALAETLKQQGVNHVEQPNFGEKFILQ